MKRWWTIWRSWRCSGLRPSDAWNGRLLGTANGFARASCAAAGMVGMARQLAIRTRWKKARCFIVDRSPNTMAVAADGLLAARRGREAAVPEHRADVRILAV